MSVGDKPRAEGAVVPMRWYLAPISSTVMSDISVAWAHLARAFLSPRDHLSNDEENVGGGKRRYQAPVKSVKRHSRHL